MRAFLLPALLSLCACSTYNDFDRALADARSARCMTAFCLGDDAAIAIEPLVEIPVGKTFALGPENTVGRFVNNNGLTAEFNLGVRVWFAHDLFSVATYLSEPLMPEGPGIRFQGSKVVHTSLDRPYPGVALGLLGDMLWLGVDYNQLNNGSGGNMDPNYRPDQSLGSTWTVSFAIAPISAFRFGLGSATARNERERVKAADAKAKELDSGLQARTARISDLERQQLDLLVAAEAAALASKAAEGDARVAALTNETIARLRIEVAEAESEYLRAEIRMLKLDDMRDREGGSWSEEASNARADAVEARKKFAQKKAELEQKQAASAPKPADPQQEQAAPSDAEA